MLLIWAHLQGLSHKGYVSKPPLPEARKANRLHAEAVKKRKDEAEAKATRKREREEEHKKACARARREGLPSPPTPDVTPGLQKDINRALIYVPRSSHMYRQ